MLETKCLNAFYGDSHILHGIDLKIPAGARVALLGRNGAGKSTLLKSLTNAGPTVKGELRFNGEDLHGLASFDRARMGIAFVPEDRRILGSMSVLENLKMAWKGTPESRRTNSPEEMLKQFPMLIPIKDRAGGLLSGGQQQILAMARAAIANPTMLLLDEPTEGLSPLIVEQLVQDVKQICQRCESSLLLCEQSVWFSRKCTDYVHLIDSGRLVFSGTWADFDANDDVRMKYLGVS
ncbi:ABC transporter ATP-binding protein [Polaromonas hydrogenivorans]|uniref:ABC transporter ATP-binding protein n=1 Tax=Polaromonas hydrogenivorans TaxID=335476 RepID=A0AAU7LZY9_9BURK